MGYRFFDIIQRHPNGTEHTSTFVHSDREPDVLRALGALPHGNTWRPRDARARNQLVAYLRSLTYSGSDLED